MARKKLEFDLVFTANTVDAKKQMKDLQNTLKELGSGSKINFSKGLTSDIANASKAASELRMHLQSATNVDTGRLNMNALERSLQKSGKTLKQYASELIKLGPEGTQSLNQIANAIANAEKPMLRLNEALDKMWVAMKNTARWQISTSALNAVTGAISSAYDYAQRLNRSLNDIRIVTGRSVDEMANFAKQANRAAQALSATTTEYTNASLIYYQQGLNDAEVAKRTEATIKLANVTRTSAETVSEWMTSIWNNFDNGSKALEYYADVITALGAATASSSEEIATGLEKFAAVAESVGLSYEYATSALATITATTRQSADVVGTALKTLFARMQDLELGKTLDDGTSLGQYSENLAKIGVNVLDASGQLRDMDNVLNDLGERWKSLTQAQKVATAQGVAGIRQYTQFMALMENWDFMQQNLATAQGSSGALQTQSEIYAESWEAAQKRVTSSAEAIYDSLLDDEAFIKLTNIFADFLDVLNPLLKGLGGIPGIIGMVTAAVVKLKGQDMAQGLRNMANELFDISSKGQKAAENLKQARLDSIRYAFSDVGDTMGPTQADSQLRMNKIKEAAASGGLNDNQKILFEDDLAIQQKLEEALLARETEIRTELENDVQTSKDKTNELQKQIDALEEQKKILEEHEALKNKGKNRTSEENKRYKELSGKKSSITKANKNASVGNLTSEIEELEKQRVAEQKVLDKKEADFKTNLSNRLENDKEGYKKLQKEAEEHAQNMETAYGKNLEDTKDWASGVVKAASVISSTTAIISSLQATWDSLSDPNVSMWEKVVTVFSSLSTVLMMLTPLFTALRGATLKDTATTALNTAAHFLNAIAKKKNAKATDNLESEIKDNLEETKADTKNVIEERVTSDGRRIRKTGAKTYQVFDPAKNSWGKGTKGTAAAFKGAQAATAGAGASGLGAAAASFGSALVAAGPILLTIAAVLAIIIGLAARVKKHEEEYGEALKRANKEAEDRKQILSETREEYDNLKASLDQINEAQKDLDLMIRGSKEWKQSVAELNQQVTELLQKYPELAKHAKYVDGVLTISEEGQELLLDEQLKEVERASAASNLAQVNANRANAAYKADSLAQDSIKVDEWGAALLGLVGPGGPIENYFIAKEVEMNREDEMREAILRLSETYDPTKDFSSLVKDLGVSDSVEKALIKNRESVLELVNSNQALEAANKQLEIAIVKSNIEGDYTEGEKAIAAEVILQREKENQKGIEEARRNAETYRVNDAKWNKQQAEEWLRQKYGDKANQLEIRNFDGDSFTIWDKEAGNVLEGSKKNGFDYNDILKDLAQQRYLDEITGEGTVKEVAEQRRAYVSNLRGYFSGKGIKATDVEFESIADAILRGDKTADISGILNFADYETLKGNIGDLQAIDPEAYKVLNESLNEYVDQREDAAEQERQNYNGLVNINQEIAKTRELLGLTADEWLVYEDAVANALGVDDETFTDAFARITGNATAAITGLNKVWNEYNEVLSNPEPLSPEYSQALGKINEQMETWLGVDNLDLKPEFIEEHLDQIQEIAHGKLDRLPQLMSSISRQLVEQFDWPTKLKNQMNSVLAGINQEVYNYGDYISQSAADQLTTLLSKSSAAEAKQIEAILSARGFAVEEAMEEGKLNVSKLRYRGLGEYADLGALEDLQKELEAQIDRYHEIKEILDDINNALDEANKRKNKAFGAGSLAYLEQETVLLQRQSEALKQYQREAEGYLIQDKAALEAAGFGFKFDTQGRISNYREIMEGLAARTDSAGMAQAKELIKQYEESLNLAEDLNGQILDNHYALLDAKLEAVTTKVELKLDINERDKEYLDFLAGLTEDDRHVTIDLIGNYTSQRGLIESNIAANEAGLKGTYNLIISGQGTKETVETMQGYYSDLLKEANNYRELGKQVIEAVKAEFESWNEDLDKAADGISHLTKVLEGLQNVIDVIGQENLGISDEVIGEMVKAQAEAANGALTASKETLEANRVALSEAETSLKIAQEELAKNPESRGAKDVVNYWQEAVDVAKKAVEEGELDVYEKWATALQAAADEFKWNTQQIADAFSEALGGIYGTIQDMSEAFGRQKELSELYLADYKKIYEVNKLNRKFNESIDTTSSVKAQRLLREAQEDLLAYQKAGVEMSKYDLEYKQKEYDLLVAQIALEEAQNAKSQVRLTKDSSGNWGYVYTADAAETEKAEQEYEDKLYAMQDFMAESEVELSEYYIQALNEYYDTVQKLAEKYGEGSEKYLKGVEEAQKVLSTKTSYSLSELEGLTTRAEQLNSNFAANCVATFRDTILGGMYSEYDNFKELQNEVTLALEESVNGLTGAYGDLQTKISNVCSLAGVDIKEFSKLATEKTNEVVNKTKDLVTEVGKIAGAYKTAFQGVLDEAKAFYGQEGQQGYKYWIDKYIEKITEWTDAMDAAMSKQAKLDKQQADAKLRETASEKFASSNFGTLLDNRATGAPDSVYNQVAKKIFENADAKGILWNYGKDGKTQQLTNKGAQIAQGAADSWKTAATSAAASSINTTMGSSTSIGSSGSKSFNTAMTAGSSAINNLGIEDYLNNTYNIGSKISGAVSSGSNKIPKVSGDDDKYTYKGVTLLTGSHYTADHKTHFLPNSLYQGRDSEGKLVYLDLSKVNSSDYTLDGTTLTIKPSALTSGVKYEGNDITQENWLKTNSDPKEYWSDENNGEWRTAYEAYDSYSKKTDWYPAWSFNGKVVKEEYERWALTSNQKKGLKPKSAYDINDGIMSSSNGSKSIITYSIKGDQPTQTKNWAYINNAIIQDKQYKAGDWYYQILDRPSVGNGVVYGYIKEDELLKKNNISRYITAKEAKNLEEPKLNIIGFNTGGYTGEWGSSGKMAMLHEKEIVLNKYDTANLLSAIDLVRQFESSLASMKWGLGALTAVNQLHHNYSDTLEQNVTIHAEFPNATDHREIEEAFGNLVNLASQYAQRK